MFDQRHVCVTTGRSGPTQAPNLYVTWRWNPGLSFRHFQTDLPKHISGGQNHYIKGWLQRRTKQMAFLWCLYQEQINPQFGGIIRNFIGYQLKLKVILIYLDLCTFIIHTLAFLISILYYFCQRRSPSPQRPLQA